MTTVYLIIAVLFVLIAVAIAGAISMAIQAKRRKKYESMAEEKLNIDRQMLNIKRSEVEDNNGNR